MSCIWHGVKLPDGWDTRAGKTGSEEYDTIVAMNGDRSIGAVTIWWKRRQFALGWNNFPAHDAKRFAGKNWRGRIIQAAIDELQDAIAESRKHPYNLESIT